MPHPYLYELLKLKQLFGTRAMTKPCLASKSLFYFLNLCSLGLCEVSLYWFWPTISLFQCTPLLQVPLMDIQPPPKYFKCELQNRAQICLQLQKRFLELSYKSLNNEVFNETRPNTSLTVERKWRSYNHYFLELNGKIQNIENVFLLLLNLSKPHHLCHILNEVEWFLKMRQRSL